MSRSLVYINCDSLSRRVRYFSRRKYIWLCEINKSYIKADISAYPEIERTIWF